MLKCSKPRTTGTEPRGAQATRRITDSSGFTLIELLVVMIIIGVLCAIAIPTFANQKTKAVSVQAKALARAAETSAETIAAERDGSYENVTRNEIHKVEPAVRIKSSTTEPYLSATTHGATEYSVTVKASDGDEFTIHRSSSGSVARTCVSPITKTGCSGKRKGTW